MLRPLLLAAVLAGCHAPAAETPQNSAAARPAPAPQALQARLEQLAAPFGERVGVAVRSLDEGWTVAVNGDRPFQQQSVFKAWLGVAVLDAVDRGVLRLDEPIRLTRADLTFAYQPIAAEVAPRGSDFTVDTLLRWSVSASDNPATDALVARLGGPSAVQAALTRLGVQDVRVDVDERGLHAIGRELRAALSAAPEAGRAAVYQRHFADPRNTATPRAAVNALARLKRGELLSAASTTRLLRLMEETTTGPQRLKAGLPTGWSLAHKTGSGGEYEGSTLVANDIGLLTSPDGRSYAVAVFTWGTRKPLAQQEALSADVARAVAAHARAAQAE